MVRNRLRVRPLAGSALRTNQRGRGRSGGRPVNGRGRMRKRGPRGGGTLRRKSPQQGQRPSSAMGPVASARSQWPRRSHNGLMHCTVKPGRYCMCAPSVAGQLRGARCGSCGRSSHGRPGQELLAWILPLLHCGVKRNEHHRLWWGCEVESLVSSAKRAASSGSDRFLKNPFLESAQARQC
jgi:hypothetical protein